MNDIDENIIKDKLTNPPDFDYSDKPWIIAKSRLDYTRKLRKYGIYTLALLFLLLAFLLAIGSYWYTSKLKKINEDRLKSTNELFPNNSNTTDTVYREKIVFIHDTIFEKVFVDTGKKKKSLNRNLSSPFHVSMYNNNLLNLAKNSGKGIKLSVFSNPAMQGLFTRLTAIGNNNILYNPLTESNTVKKEKVQRWSQLLKLPLRMSQINYKRKNISISDYLYKKWLADLSNKITKRKNSLSYKLSKALNGFNIFGYEIKGEAGGLISLSGVPSTGYVMGLSGNLLFENGFKFTIGMDFIANQGEYKTQNISSQDFPPAPDTKGIFDGVYFNSSYWLVPVGFEYHFIKIGKIYPYLGIGWIVKSGTLNTLEYELHDINTFKEYKLSNAYHMPADLNNYRIKTGLNINFSDKTGSSLEASYLFGNKKYEYNYQKLRSLMFSAIVYYRFN